MSSEIADGLGIDWKSGLKGETNGIERTGPVATYYVDVEYDIANLNKSRRKVKFGVIERNLPFVLLGQLGFFDFYKVTFRRNLSQFIIEPN